MPKSDSTLELLPLALMGLNQAHREGYQIRKAGVILNDLELADSAPRRLWDGALYAIHKRLIAAVDSPNAKFGIIEYAGRFDWRGVRKKAGRFPPRHRLCHCNTPVLHIACLQPLARRFGQTSKSKAKVGRFF
jgi:hypothetical protein